MKKYGWGILSTGRIVDWFCGDFHKVEQGELIGVASRSQESADKFASRYNIPNAYGDYVAMLENPDIDVIYIGTPHTVHFHNAKAALEAGKAVLCEKPLTVGAQDSRELIKIAADSGQYLLEAMWTYFLPALQKAKAWVEDGRIGDLVHIKTDFGYPVPYAEDQREYDARLGGGCLLEMGIYPVAIAYFFAGKDPKDIMATGSFAPNGVEEDVSAIFKYEDFTAMIGTSFKCRQRNAAYIVGTEGYIVIPDAFRAHEASLYVLEDRVEHFIAHRDTKGYEYQAIALCSDLDKGLQQSPIMPHSASLAFQEHIDRIKDAIK